MLLFVYDAPNAHNAPFHIWRYLHSFSPTTLQFHPISPNFALILVWIFIHRWPHLEFLEWLWMRFLTCKSPYCPICPRPKRRRTFPGWLKTRSVRGSRNGTFSSITSPKKGTPEIRMNPRTPQTQGNYCHLFLKHTRKNFVNSVNLVDSVDFVDFIKICRFHRFRLIHQFRRFH